MDEMCVCFAYGYAIVCASREENLLRLLQFLNAQNFIRPTIVLFMASFWPTEINENQTHMQQDRRGENKRQAQTWIYVLDTEAERLRLLGSWAQCALVLIQVKNSKVNFQIVFT